MPDVRNVLIEATQQLGERLDAELLLLHVLQKPRSWLFAHVDDVIDADVQMAYAALLERRVQGEPVAYITGHRGFWSMDIEVSLSSLIPRPETELLVEEQALMRLPPDIACSVADLGTGSGAIALAIAHERPRAQVIATDASADALVVALRNAQRNGLSITSRSCTVMSWLAPLAGPALRPDRLQSALHH